MKVSREQVAEHRLQILAAAARLFRLRGFEGVTVAEVMKDAGPTHGVLLPLVCFQVWERKPRADLPNSDTA
jgi:Bacterial regulatory proteins, tetR family